MKRIAFFLVAGFLFVGNFCLFPLPAHADDLTSLTITSYTKSGRSRFWRDLALFLQG